MFIFPAVKKDGKNVYIINKIVLPHEKRRFREVFLGNDYFKYYDTDEIIDFDLE